MESHAVYVSQAEVFADIIARVIAGHLRKFDAQRRQLEGVLKKIGKPAESLARKKTSSQLG